MGLLSWTEKGLYCKAGDFYIDPRRGVTHAIITHAHSDHLRRASAHYYCARSSVALVRHRLGPRGEIHAMDFGVSMSFGPVNVSLHPAGHILGSAQVRLELGGEVWVVSGDFKRAPDASCEPFEVVPCDTFVTEATFGEPKYKWPDAREVVADIYDWWQQRAKEGKNALLIGYSLGKTQRLMAELGRLTDRTVIVSKEGHEIADHYRREGMPLLPSRLLETIPDDEMLRGELIIATHSIFATDWPERLGFPESAFVSGWTLYPGRGEGFVLSDHADWDDLLRTIRETGARRVFIHTEGAGRERFDTGGARLMQLLQREGRIAGYIQDADLPQFQSPVQGELFRF